MSLSNKPKTISARGCGSRRSHPTLLIHLGTGLERVLSGPLRGLTLEDIWTLRTDL